jgi:hypothetical protein
VGECAAIEHAPVLDALAVVEEPGVDAVGHAINLCACRPAA